MGYYAGRENTGGGLVAVGYLSGWNNTGASNCVMIGRSTGKDNTGARLQAFGYDCGNGNTYDDVLLIGYDLDASAAHEFRLGNTNSNSTPLLYGEMDHVNVVIGYGDENNDYPTLEIHGKPAGDALQKFAMEHSSDNPNVFRFVQDTEVETTAHELGGNTSTYLWEVYNSDDKEIIGVSGDLDVRIGYGSVEGDTPVWRHYSYPTGAPDQQQVTYTHANGTYTIEAADYVDEMILKLGGTSSTQLVQVVDSAGERQFEAAADGDVYVQNRLGIGADPGHPLYVYADSAERLRVQDDGTLRINDEYDMPTVDGDANDVMTTDGADTVSWTSLSEWFATATGYSGSDVQIYGNDSGSQSWENLNPSTSVDTIGSAAEGSESADATTWTAGGTNGVEIYEVTRIGYYDAGDETLYAYVRKMTYNRFGCLYSVSGETRVSIEVPEAC
jgi:hypothetical protein